MRRGTAGLGMSKTSTPSHSKPNCPTKPKGWSRQWLLKYGSHTQNKLQNNGYKTRWKKSGRPEDDNRAWSLRMVCPPPPLKGALEPRKAAGHVKFVEKKKGCETRLLLTSSMPTTVSQRWSPMGGPWTALSHVRWILRGSLDHGSPWSKLRGASDIIEEICRRVIEVSVVLLRDGPTVRLRVPQW